MKILNLVSDRSAWNDPEPWTRFEGYFGEAGRTALDLRDHIANMNEIDIKAKVSVSADEMVELIHRGHARALRDFPGQILDDILYLLCPLAADDEGFVRKYMGGISAFAAKNAVLIYANPVGDWQNTFLRMVLHETNHTARYPFGDPYDSFLNWVVFEGMTERYLAEVQPYEKLSPWVTAATAQQLAELLPEVRRFWDGFEPPNGTPRQWFFGSEELHVPQWFGYALGYRLVSKHREAQPGLAWADYIKTKSSDFASIEL